MSTLQPSVKYLKQHKSTFNYYRKRNYEIQIENEDTSEGSLQPKTVITRMSLDLDFGLKLVSIKVKY